MIHQQASQPDVSFIQKQHTCEAVSPCKSCLRNISLNKLYGYISGQVIFDQEGCAVDFIFIEVNEGHEILTGRKDVVGLRATDVFASIQNANPGFIEKQLRVTETGIPLRFELYLEPERKWFDISAQSIKKEYFTAIIDDITERKQVERALRESEERFRSLFEDHSAIMLVLDPETGAIVDANRAAADFYGWDVDELKATDIWNLNNSNPEAAQQEMERWKKMEEGHLSFRHRRADGSIRDVEIYGKKIKRGGQYLVYDIIHDVTERKQYELVNEFRLRLLQNAETEAVEQLLKTTLDEAERLTGSNFGFLFFVAEDQKSLLLRAVSTSTLEKMCAAEGIGKASPLDKAGVWSDLFRERKAVIHNEYPSLAHCGGMREGHAVIRRELVIPVIRDARIVAIMGVGNKLTDYDKRDIEWVELLANQVWDIVAKKIAEEEQEKMHAQLQQSMKMEMIGQLAAGIAHEIGNPLNYITLNEYNLQDDFDDLCHLVGQYRRIIGKFIAGKAETKEVERLLEKESELAVDQLLKTIPETLENSKSGIERITAITRSMKSYSFKNVLQKISALDLNKVVDETLVIAKHEYSDIATVALTLEELPPLFCDPSQINQVVLNLIINASHAIRSQKRKSPGLIAIKTWATVENIFFSITDDGPGISEEIQKRIFDPFFTTKEQGKGTGLGLSISHEIIVKKYLGTFSVASPSEGGTTFTFSLPIQIAPQLLLQPEEIATPHKIKHS